MKRIILFGINKMTDAIETIKYRGYKIEIIPDDNCESPRDYQDNLGVFHCWHKNINLGDDNYNLYNDCDKDILNNVLKEAKNNNDIIYPLYCYQHSGIALSLSNTYPFNDRWDAGQVGYIIVDREKAIKEYGHKILTQNLKDRVHKVIENEINTYNQYLAGDVYGYNITKEGDVDSCWGYYGMDYIVEEAKSVVDYQIKNEIKEHCKKVKQWINNHVPFIYRHKLSC